MSYCNCNTSFKGITNIADDQLLNILESNLKMFLDWSFLKIGSWFDVSMNQSTIYGENSHSHLIVANDPSYTDGCVWQSIRKDWAWETGINFSGTNPISISGVYINNSFVNYNTNTFKIDYPNGRIILDDPISLNSSVKLEYSYRYIQTHRSCDSPWFNILQLNSMDTSNKDISRTEDGDWSIGSNKRIQMPCIIVESLPRSRSKPYEIGNDNLILEQDVAFHVFAETKNERNKLLDIIRLQQDNNLILFNTNSVSQNECFPLDYIGDKIQNAMMYPDIVANYKWRTCWLKNISLYEIDSFNPNLYRGVARCTTEIISD